MRNHLGYQAATARNANNVCHAGATRHRRGAPWPHQRIGDLETGSSSNYFGNSLAKEVAGDLRKFNGMETTGPWVGYAPTSQPVSSRPMIRSHASDRRFRQRSHKSTAAPAQSGKRNRNPEVNSLPGTTRRLLRISSVSVRKTKAPASSIHLDAGKPQPRPHASRRPRMKSALGRGFGAEMLIGPVSSR